MTNIFSISFITAQYFFSPPLVHIVTYSTVLNFTVTRTVTVLCFTATVTLLLQLNGGFDGIWTFRGLRRRFRRGYGDFGFYDHSDIMIKMIWSQGGHIKRRQLQFTSVITMWEDIFLCITEAYFSCEFKKLETDSKQRQRMVSS